jgi:hypothetical protein
MNEYLVISRIDKDLIYYLEEAGHILDVPLDHALCIRVIRPDILGYGLYAADVRVWSYKNMISWGEL